MKAFLAAVAAMAFSAGAEEKDPTLKPLWKKLKVASIDAKLGEIRVKEADVEVLWKKESTRFLHHRSILLKDLKSGAAIHVLGRLHVRRGAPPTKGAGETSPMITDIEHLGVGAAFVEPPIQPASGFVRWHAGKLVTVAAPFQVEVGNGEYRLSGGEKLAAYSIEKLAPESVAGATVIVRGDARKVTVEREGKERQVTRIYATEVHLVELSAEHLKVFQLQWGEKRKETPPGPEEAAARRKDRQKRPTILPPGTDREAPSLP
jgi:hypothetical protein